MGKKNRSNVHCCLVRIIECKSRIWKLVKDRMCFAHPVCLEDPLSLSRKMTFHSSSQAGASTWTVVSRCHLHQKSHLLAFRQWVTKQNVHRGGLLTPRLLFYPLLIRTIFICRKRWSTKAIWIPGIMTSMFYLKTKLFWKTFLACGRTNGKINHITVLLWDCLDTCIIHRDRSPQIFVHDVKACV